MEKVARRPAPSSFSSYSLVSTLRTAIPLPSTLPYVPAYPEHVTISLVESGAVSREWARARAIGDVFRRSGLDDVETWFESLRKFVSRRRVHVNKGIRATVTNRAEKSLSDEISSPLVSPLDN